MLSTAVDERSVIERPHVVGLRLAGPDTPAATLVTATREAGSLAAVVVSVVDVDHLAFSAGTSAALHVAHRPRSVRPIGPCRRRRPSLR